MRSETESFNWKKALFALQGKIAVTDESSHFEWIGSNGAGPCIIMLVHGVNESGQKVAVCGHLSAAESPYSLNLMLGIAGIKDILSAYLVSGYTTKEDAASQLLLDILKKRGVENPTLSLGQGVTEIAINVRTGKVSYEVTFTPQNAGEEDLSCLKFYALQAEFNILSSPTYQIMRPMLQLSVDGRNSEHVSRIISLVETAKPPVRYSDNFYESFELFSLGDSFDLDQIFLTTLLESLFQNKQMKALPAPPERKMITYPAWEKAKINLENPRPAFSSRFFSNYEKDYLTEHRHDSSALQHEYDKRFGLVLKN